MLDLTIERLYALIAEYGYLAILVGTFLEGETVLILGGFAAHQNYLDLPWVILCAFVGSLCGDQLFFVIGRRHSQALLFRFPAWQSQVLRANRLLDRYRVALILSFRFLYGLRTVTPFVIGMSNVRTLYFILLNAVSASIWATLFGLLGYLFGGALEILLGNIRRFEILAAAAIAVIGLALWAVYFYRRRPRKSSPAP